MAQRPGMVEREKIVTLDRPTLPGNRLEPPRDGLQERGCEARARQQDRERVEVVADRPAAHQGGLEGRRAAPHERVMDPLPPRGQARDEEGGQLRLEAGAVADFMERMRLTLRR